MTSAHEKNVPVLAYDRLITGCDLDMYITFDNEKVAYLQAEEVLQKVPEGNFMLLGGRGSIFGTFLGALVMATVIQGMDYTNLENWLQLIVRGSVLVLAVGLDVIAKNPPPWARRLRNKFWRYIKPGAKTRGTVSSE